MSRSLLSAASLVLATIICIGLACGAGNSAGALPVAKRAAGGIAGATQKPEADVALLFEHAYANPPASFAADLSELRRVLGGELG